MNEKIVVTIASWPPRIKYVADCVKSLLEQSRRPDSIEVNLSRVEFPNGLHDLPEQQKAYCVLDAMYQRDTGIACKALGTGSVDCKILRVTNHALWMARALELSRFDVDKYIYNHMMSKYWKDGDEIFNLACKAMQNKIDKTKEILLKKAEEYK